MPLVNPEDAESEIDEVVDGEPLSAVELVRAVARRPNPKRLKSGFKCFDHVLGGGVVPGSMTLVCGSPGAGKSTLILQALNALAKKSLSYYVTGEEPIDQVASTLKRLKLKPSVKLQLAHDTDFDNILDKVEEMKPAIVVIDSLNTLAVDDSLEVGSATSIKEAIRQLWKFAKQQRDWKPAFILVGHVRKDGGISGPKALEHMVDANVYLQGNRSDSVRTLRCDEKNRFAGGELPCWATFQMGARGLEDLETHLEQRKREERERRARAKEAARRAKAEEREKEKRAAKPEARA